MVVQRIILEHFMIAGGRDTSVQDEPKKWGCQMNGLIQIATCRSWVWRPPPSSSSYTHQGRCLVRHWYQQCRGIPRGSSGYFSPTGILCRNFGVGSPNKWTATPCSVLPTFQPYRSKQSRLGCSTCSIHTRRLQKSCRRHHQVRNSHRHNHLPR